VQPLVEQRLHRRAQLLVEPPDEDLVLLGVWIDVVGAQRLAEADAPLRRQRQQAERS